MEGEQFSLCWNNFHSNLSSGFHNLLKDEDLVDVTLAADGKYLKAHKTVLSVCSPYFKDLFRANPCKHPIVVLHGVDYQALTSLLQFMYQGEVSVTQEEIPTFMKVAETLKVKGLTDNVGNENGNDSRHSFPMDQRGIKRARPPQKKIIRPMQNIQQFREQFRPIAIRSPHPPPPKKSMEERPAVAERPTPAERPSQRSPDDLAPSASTPQAGSSSNNSVDSSYQERMLQPKQEPTDPDDEQMDENFDMSLMCETSLDNPADMHGGWDPMEAVKAQDTSSPAPTRHFQVVTKNSSDTEDFHIKIENNPLVPIKHEESMSLTVPFPIKKTDTLANTNTATIQQPSKETEALDILPTGSSSSSGCGSSMIILRSARGQLVLIYNGHIYTVLAESGDNCLWVCVKKKIYNCEGCVRTKGNILPGSNPALIKYSAHNHPQLHDVIWKLKSTAMSPLDM